MAPRTAHEPDLEAAVSAVFAEDGALARRLRGFEPRPGQRAMAAAVCQTLQQGGVLLAEAGTGTGKTLAYLVPALLNGRRALVSTGTKNLQDQIVDKDIPLLEQALGSSFRTVCMKGRGNYLCLQRFETARGNVLARPPQERMYMALVEQWAETTGTGDRAEIDDLPEDLPLWSDVSARVENCMGKECPRYDECFLTRLRTGAAEADLVIVNHHLLCADAAVRHHSFGEVIPECPVAIIDEAHQLEDIATQFFGVMVSNYRLEELVRDGERLLKAHAVPDTRKTAELRRALAHVDVQGREFFQTIERSRPGSAVRPAAPAQGLFDERRRLTADDLESLAETAIELLGALDALDSTVNLLVDGPEELRAIGRRALEARDSLRFVLLASDPAFVYFLETRGRGVFLRALPIDVSPIMGEVLFERMHATVLTSATLAVNGSFDYVRARLGLHSAAEIRLPSEFDYARQSILYLPRHMPDPRMPTFNDRAADEVIEILRRTEGRAFVLFTSYAALRAVRVRVQAALPYPLFVQGEAPRPILLERYRATPNSVLLATSSFWQGVDVVGEALSCVIIDKLPFASPADPIVQARAEAIASQGGDPFNDYQVPLAVLTLLQGVGRLLRHRTDRGVLVVLDPRLRTKGYGRRFLDALPASPITHDLEDIERFFAGDRDD